MSDPVTVGAFAIVPCSDLNAAVPFWERLGSRVPAVMPNVSS